jgi:hypothetical protein
MRRILEANQELDAILLRLDSLDFDRAHLAVEGRRRGNAVQLSLIGLLADFEIVAVELNFTERSDRTCRDCIVRPAEMNKLSDFVCGCSWLFVFSNASTRKQFRFRRLARGSLEMEATRLLDDANTAPAL